MEIQDIVVGGMYRFSSSYDEKYIASVLSEQGNTIDEIRFGERFVVLQNFGPTTIKFECADGVLYIFKILTPDGKVGRVAMWPGEMVPEKEKE
jgi:hypothetical protein